MSRVLVTGGSGFIASHTLLQLLAAGHEVRATIRNLAREPELRRLLERAGAERVDRLSFVAADLEFDAGWPEAASTCDYVLHMASPFPAGVPKHPDELITPAREGTLRVLRAARAASVKRVVVTSSFAAVGYGHPGQQRSFNESDWTNADGPAVAAYVKSKTLAERAAWDFIAAEGGTLELAVVNPVAVFGPVLGSDFAASILVVKRMMDGTMPGCPDLYFGVVDVRDVADLHLRVMTHPNARGERFLAVAGDCMSLLEIAAVIRERMGTWGRKAPRRRVPNWLLRIAALGSPLVREILPELGKVKNASNAKARRVLEWNPRPNAESILATAESLVRLGLITGAAKAP
jgi:nucleoside-diphosphate-sugar epimerase